MSLAARGARLALAAGLAALATAAWFGYQRPDFLLWLASASWLCT
jgi:hypothetical protein